MQTRRPNFFQWLL